MNTFLFAWNPIKWLWEIEENIKEIKQKGSSSEKWNVISHRKIKYGDRAFLVRVGKEPRGLIASGFVTSEVFLDKSWNKEEDKLAHRVIIDFDTILNADREPILNWDTLKQDLPKGNWTPQSSGIKINKDISEKLEKIWFDFLNKKDVDDISFTENKYYEGNPSHVLITKYERNPYARKACIEKHGLSCSVCSFNFEEKYGELGEGFIQVHHLHQISTMRKEHIINPIDDLRPICPNCHAMIHKRKEPYTIEELAEILKKEKTNLDIL